MSPEAFRKGGLPARLDVMAGEPPAGLPASSGGEREPCLAGMVEAPLLSSGVRASRLGSAHLPAGLSRLVEDGMSRRVPDGRLPLSVQPHRQPVAVVLSLHPVVTVPLAEPSGMGPVHGRPVNGAGAVVNFPGAAERVRVVSVAPLAAA